MYQEEEELLEELRQSGVYILGINNLFTVAKNDVRVIPVIVKYLKKSDNYNFKEYLVRCLAKKGNNKVSRILLSEFYKSYDIFYRLAIGKTLSIIADESILNEVIEIIKNKDYGVTRQIFVEGLVRYKTNVSNDIIELLNDEEIQGQVIYVLSKMRDSKMIEYIKPFVNNENNYIREMSINAIKNLEKYK